MGSAETVMSACQCRVCEWGRGQQRASKRDAHPRVCMLLHKVHVIHAVQVVAWKVGGVGVSITRSAARL
jgi:hypothetical protein